MERETNETVELIDLGAASVETRGQLLGDVDGAGLIQFGLSDD